MQLAGLLGGVTGGKLTLVDISATEYIAAFAKKMEEASDRATEERSLSQDDNAKDVADTEQKNIISKSGAQATQPQLHRGDLEDDRPHKIIKKKNPSEQIVHIV